MNHSFGDDFYTMQDFDDQKQSRLLGPNGWLLFVACNSAIDDAYNVKKSYEALVKENGGKDLPVPILGSHENPVVRVFSDSETCPRLEEHVAGSDAYVFQNCHEKVSGNTVNENIQQLLQVIRTLRAHRAQTITVITPYSPYSRQDKPTFMRREAALASLFADQLKVAGADCYLSYHPHTLGLYGFYEPQIKFVALSALDLFVNVFDKMKGRDDVLAIAPDAGGVKFTVHFADAMNISHAIASKYRTSGDSTSFLGIIGDLDHKKKAIIVDDETVTGGTLLNTVRSLYEERGIEESYIGVSHLKTDKQHLHKFIEANEKYGLKEVHVTDSIPQRPEVLELPFVHIHSLANVFAAIINRLHFDQSVSKVFTRS